MYQEDEKFHIVLFNGPPRSGKDTAALYAVEKYDEVEALVKFARPIKDSVRKFYGLSKEEWEAWDSPENKDTPTPVFHGKTCRECQIAMSEVYAKPFHKDKSIFGKIFSANVRRWYNGGIIVVSDSGFVEEAVEVCAQFGVDNVTLVRVRRPNCNYANDSRSYVHLADLGVKEFELNNDGSILGYQQAVDEVLEDVLQRYKR